MNINIKRIISTFGGPGVIRRARGKKIVGEIELAVGHEGRVGG